MTKTSKVSAANLPESFEQASIELENIVAEMEAGQMSLEASLDAYKRGAALLQFCQKQLQDAQQQVRILEADLLKDYTISDTHDR
ncbi:MAG: exodeoxyribonuclease VII small subunit [Burkholderiales bacterium]|nr:exodeoxyribonuclease VII small subunit [Burkholderiales bacterium]MDR4518550.1 exodeoxyribonuclease VII small subunit [Nitrosomonas sp.]